MSYDQVGDGQLAAVATFLEMLENPNAEVPPSPLSLQRIDRPVPAAYRELFRRVGAPWLWFSRLIMDDADLIAIIQDPSIALYSVRDPPGDDVGMLELDFREPRECELTFVGLVPTLSGQGHGKWLLAEAVNRGFRDDVRRLHVHTCSLDHPAALAAYRRAGFVPFKRAIERFPDPRLLGILPADCAPHIPVIGSPESVSPRPSS